MLAIEGGRSCVENLLVECLRIMVNGLYGRRLWKEKGSNTHSFRLSGIESQNCTMMAALENGCLENSD